MWAFSFSLFERLAHIFPPFCELKQYGFGPLLFRAVPGVLCYVIMACGCLEIGWDVIECYIIRVSLLLSML